MAASVIENRAYLSEIDGKIGDGDHGVNMAKGFNMAAERIRGKDMSLSDALDTLGTVLVTEIGGSMGPLYGVIFSGFADALDGVEEIDAPAFERMLRNGLAEVLKAMGRYPEALAAYEQAAQTHPESVLDQVLRPGPIAKSSAKRPRCC